MAEFSALRRSFSLLLVILLLRCTPKVESSLEAAQNIEMRQAEVPRNLMVPSKNSRYPSRKGPQGSRIRMKNQPRYQMTQKMTTSNALVECPEGFSRVEGKCVRLISSPAKLGCAEGWVFNNGMCVGYEDVPTQLRCDEGYTLESGECTKTQESPKELSCPEDFELVQDSCFQTIRVSPDMYCPPGFQFIDNVCHGQTTGEPVARCPPEYFMHHGTCAREILLPGKLTCAAGSVFDGNMCVITALEEVLHGCPKGFIKEGHICVRHSAIKAERTCVNMRSPNSKECDEEHFVCPAGCSVVAKASLCKCIDSKPTEMGCPKHYHLRSDSKMCVKYDKQPASIYCPRGFFPFHGECKKVETQKIEKLCPPGQIAGVDGLCQGKLKHEAMPKCPAEYSLVFEHDGPICKGQKSSTPKIECPNGFSWWKNKCFHKDTKPLRPLCPLGFHVMGGSKCVKRVEQFAAVLCPEGFTHQFGTCVKQLVRDSVGLCPKGFGYDRQMQECFKMFTSYDFYNGIKEDAYQALHRLISGNVSSTPSGPPTTDLTITIPASAPPRGDRSDLGTSMDTIDSNEGSNGDDGEFLLPSL